MAAAADCDVGHSDPGGLDFKELSGWQSSPDPMRPGLTNLAAGHRHCLTIQTTKYGFLVGKCLLFPVRKYLNILFQK